MKYFKHIPYSDQARDRLKTYSRLNNDLSYKEKKNHKTTNRSLWDARSKSQKHTPEVRSDMHILQACKLNHHNMKTFKERFLNVPSIARCLLFQSQGHHFNTSSEPAGAWTHRLAPPDSAKVKQPCTACATEHAQNIIQKQMDLG